MKNSEIIQKILHEAEENHLNLYHSIRKEEVLKYISEIQNVDDLSDVEFDREMLKLFALFKDAHTSYYIPKIFTDSKLIFIDNKLYLNEDGRYKEVISIGGLSIDVFLQQLSKMQNYETEEHLNVQMGFSVNNGYYYEMLGLVSDGSVKCLVSEDGNVVEHAIKVFTREESDEKRKKLFNMPRFYEYKIVDGKYLYVKYWKCRENEDYPFSEFVKELKAIIKKHGITQYILDVRGNQGGNSEILNPFQDLVREKNLHGVLLIDNGVFSSGRFAVARFKKDFNTPLIGEATGGAAKSYGYNKNLEVEGKRFSVSIRLWDFSDIFGYEGAIQPDIFVPLTIEDIENNKDRQLDIALQVLSSENAGEQ